MTLRLSPRGFDKAALTQKLHAAGCDALLLTSPENVYYATGYPTMPGSGNPILFTLKNQLPFYALLGADGAMTLIAWIGATAGFEFGADEVRSFFDSGSAAAELQETLQARLQPGQTLGIESTCPYAVAELAHTSVADLSFKMLDNEIMAQRLIKSGGEIELMRRATQIVEQTVAELRSRITVGMSRLQVIQMAKWLMVARGATGISHTTIAFGASNPEIAYDETLQPEQIVTLDLGASVLGYVSDNRRLLYTGEIPVDISAHHEMMCGIVAEVGAALQPGTPFNDLYALASLAFEAHGLPPFFFSVGHSLGLNTEEIWIGPESAYTVQPGMVLNIELYSSGPQSLNIGDEETYLITPEGPVRLTESDPSMQSI